MTKRTKKLLSLLLASAMVFTMNTTVFAEEVAVDSVDEAVEASVDAAEEIAADATVDEVAVVDAVTDVNSGETTESANNYYMYDEKGNISTKIEYNNDGEVSVIRNVLSPVSWNEIVDFGTEEGYGAPELIETVLTGDDYEDSYLSNSKSIKVSDNSPKASVEGLKGGKRTYDVQDLGNGYFLFVGYGSNRELVEGVTGFAPVLAWDGRQIDWAKDGVYTATASKENALYVDIALAKYEGNTLTKVDGFKVKKVKVDKKNAKHATVSGQSTLFEYKKGVTEPIYAALSGYTNPTFTITATIPKEVKDLKKTINTLLKDKKYTFAIRQKIVYADYYDENTIKYDEEKGTVSTANLEDWDITRAGNVDNDSIDLSYEDFTISKFDATKKKANIVLNVQTDNGKGTVKDATVTLKSGKKDAEYEFVDGNLGGTTVQVLKFADNGNYAYFNYADEPDGYVEMLTAEGYKFAFEQTPTTDGKKKVKTFRGGIFKDTNDGFVYSVED